ncbi:MAG: hypothetical protein QXM43_00960 [Desulfurococcaceae archaeon]
MASKISVDDLRKLFSKEVNSLTQSDIYTMRIIFEYMKNKDANVPANYIEKRYNSVYVYEVLKKLQNIGLVKQIKPENSKSSFYTLTEKGLLILSVTLEETDNEYREAEKLFINRIIGITKHADLVDIGGRGSEALAEALAKACSQIIQVDKGCIRIVSRGSKMDSYKLYEEMCNVLKLALRDEVLAKKIAWLALRNITSSKMYMSCSQEDWVALIENILKKTLLPYIKFTSFCINFRVLWRLYRPIVVVVEYVVKFIKMLGVMVIISGIAGLILILSIFFSKL